MQTDAVMRRFPLFLMGLVLGCGSASQEGEGAGGAFVGEDGRGGSGGPSGSGGGGGGGGSDAGPQPGQLTAGVWDDNQNFEFYLSYLDAKAKAGLPGAPSIPRKDRLRVRVADKAGAAHPGARVVVKRDGAIVQSGTAGADGRVDVYPTWAGVPAGAALQIEARYGDLAAFVDAKAGDDAATVTLSDVATAPMALDVAVVIDTTGSMSDEITYLRSELSGIAASVRARWPSASQRWAIVAYKDDGDTYVVQTKDFVADADAAQAEIAALSASGGGDYPEAPDQALQKTMALSWRPGNVARLAFWIADAPHHPGREGTLVEALKVAREKGVHVYPIAASGADALTELSMRTAAQLTLGRYLFVTDDSGIGGTHKEPEIPCYYVTRLSAAMGRMIGLEMTGTYVGPTKEEILRVGGDPKDGRCTLSSGQQVGIF